MSSATLAPLAWNAARGTGASGPWRFAQVLWSERGPMLQWVMRRNCSLTPRQLFAVYLSLCAVSLVIAGGFSLNGAPPVLAFAGVELSLVGLSLLIYARHAADRETITLAGERLRVEHRCGRALRRSEFRAAWVSVEPVHGEGSLLELSGEGQRLRVGRYLRPELRTPLAQELRRALRGPGVQADIEYELK